MTRLALSPRRAVGTGPTGSSGPVQTAFNLLLYNSTCRSANTYVWLSKAPEPLFCACWSSLCCLFGVESSLGLGRGRHMFTHQPPKPTLRDQYCESHWPDAGSETEQLKQLTEFAQQRRHLN